MKNYLVTIYGRSNSIILSVRDRQLTSEMVTANSHKEAVDKAWNKFHAEEGFLTRRDVRIESEDWTDMN